MLYSIYVRIHIRQFFVPIANKLCHSAYLYCYTANLSEQGRNK